MPLILEIDNISSGEDSLFSEGEEKKSPKRVSDNTDSCRKKAKILQ